MRNYFILSVLFLACACGPRGGKTVSDAPARRDFPQVEIPSMYTDQAERVGYVVGHFWDKFTDTARVYACDSLTVNGVSTETVESQMGMFATLLDQVPLPEASRAVSHLYDRIDAFARKYPDSNMFKEMCRLTNRYLYDPNSPVRNEDYYLPFVERMATSDLIDEAYHTRYAWEANTCRLNRVGTPAADFSFIDTHGRPRTLYGIKADYLVLIFANPGCKACRDITEAMTETPEISDLIGSGRVKVVDVYIDQEIDDWKAHIADYPADWICGYDPNYTIRTDVIYNVRAIPSIYLLDNNKSVLMKDAPQEKVLDALARL